MKKHITSARVPTIRANALEERELIGLARNIPFDDRINNHAKIADMRSSLLSEYLHNVGSGLYEGSLSRTVEDVATDMRLVGAFGNEKTHQCGLDVFQRKTGSFLSV